MLDVNGGQCAAKASECGSYEKKYCSSYSENGSKQSLYQEELSNMVRQKLVRTCIEKGLCIFSVCSEKLGITVPVERINSRYIMIATAMCNHHQENN